MKWILASCTWAALGAVTVFAVTVFAVTVFAVGVFALGVRTAGADGEFEKSRVPRATHADVPDLFNAKLAQADAILGHRGLKRGVVYEISRERMYAYLRAHAPHITDPADYARRFKRGRVFSQTPRSGKAVVLGSPVDIVLVARNDGKVPPHPFFRDLEIQALPASGETAAAPTQPAGKRAAGPLPSSGTGTPQGEPVVRRTGPQPAAPDTASPDTASRDAASPDAASPRVARPPVEAPAGAPGGGRTGPTPRADSAIATGSPEAPREAGMPDPTRVPHLVGLGLIDAESLAREAGVELYIERVAGHPVGRVLAQAPAGGTLKPAGNVVKITVTAGGDYEAASPPAPEVYMTRVDVPDLLDRTKLQARRILEALGLEVVEEQAPHGMPGRVVDQRPALGTHVKKGSAVVIRLGPGELPKPPTGPYRGTGADAPSTRARTERDAPPTRSRTERDAPPTRSRTERDAHAEAPPATQKGRVPRPISPTSSTKLPTDASIPLGFSWRKVENATAYLIEVEERTATGDWLASVRKPVRTTAVMLELERLDSKATRAFRWRVRAIFDGKPGRTSPWIVMR